MTYDESTLFMKFMQGKGVMNNFEYLYRSHRFDKRSLEQYLDDVDAEDVILSAFDFSGAGNTIFGFKYWKEINEKWLAKLTEFRNTGILTADEAQVYCPHCQRVLPRTAFAVKSNGQLHKHCKECEGGKWDKERKEREKAEKEAEKKAKAKAQLEKEIADKQAKLQRLAAQAPTPGPAGKDIVNNRAETARQQIADGQANIDKTTKVCSHCGKRKLRTEFYKSDSSEDGLQEYCKTCQTELLAAAEEAERLEVEKRQLETEIAEREAEMQRLKAEQEAENTGTVPVRAEPTECHEEPEIRTAPRLSEHDVTLHFKASEKRIVLNAILSAVVRDAGLQKCYLSTDRQGRQFLVFNNAEGANVTKITSRTSDLLQVCSSSICRQIAERFGLSVGDNYYLHVTKNLAHRQDVVNVEVKRARSREEYAVIVSSREEAVRRGSVAADEEVEKEDPANDVPLLEFSFVNGTGHTGDGQAPATGEGGGSPAPEPEPVKTGAAGSVEPGSGRGIPLTNRDSQQLLQQLTERGHVSERDMAAFLYHKGWELHEPVVVTRHKKFSL